MKKHLRKIDLKLTEGQYESPVKGLLRFPEELYTTFKKIKDQDQETLIGVYLDEELKIKAYDILGLGGDKGILVSLRDVFGRGLMKIRIIGLCLRRRVVVSMGWVLLIRYCFSVGIYWEKW